jgi:MFS family permease
MPFASVYMLALGATDTQIGLVASLTLLFRAVTAVFSGIVTDKFGRRATACYGEIISWVVPSLMWALAGNIYWFYAAAVLNGCREFPGTSWTCLLVEDAEKSQLVVLYNWISLCSQLAVFFGPLAGLLISRAGIIPGMRVLYGFSFVSMLIKCILLYLMGEETAVGKIRREETKGKSLAAILGEYKHLLPRFIRSDDLKLAVTVAVLYNGTRTVMENFFGVYATQVEKVPDQTLAYFPIVRSAVVLLFIFFIQNRLIRFGYRKPMLVGAVLYIASHALLIFWPGGGMLPLWIYTIVESCAYGLFSPRYDSVIALLIDPAERARMFSLMTFVMLGVNFPIGYIAGRLSDMNRTYPFMLNMVLFTAAFLVIMLSKKMGKIGESES